VLSPQVLPDFLGQVLPKPGIVLCYNRLYLVGSQGLPAFYRSMVNRINSRVIPLLTTKLVYSAASPAATASSSDRA